MIWDFQDYLREQICSNKSIANELGIYFSVPSNSKFPYIYIGDFVCKDASVKLRRITEINFNIFIYYRDKRGKYYLRFAKEVENTLLLSEIIKIKYKGLKISSHSDGVTEHICLLYKALIEEV